MTEARRVEAAAPSRADLIGLVSRFAPLIFLIVLMAAFSIFQPRFLSPLNLFNVMRQVSVYGLLAVGMTFVILTAGIDLSIGSLLAFAGLVAAAVDKGGLSNRFSVGAGQDALGYGWPLAALAAVAVGLAGVGGLGLFLVVETRVDSPMLDLSLFRNRVFSTSTSATLLNALARGAFTFVLVFYLQGPPRYLDPFTAGLYLIPVSASLATFGPISGWLSDRYGPTWFTVFGLLFSAAGFLWLATIGAEDSFVQLAPPLVLVGAGMGLFAAPNRATMMTAVPPNRRGVASGIGTTLLNTGSTVSLALTLVIMSAVVPRAALETILTGGTVTGGAGIAAGFLSSIHLIFFVSAGLVLVSLVPIALRGRPPPPPPEPGPAGD